MKTLARTLTPRRIAMATIFAVSLAGCDANNRAFFTGDASMRIDVEVYKGPIAQEPDIQWGKLHGYISETEQSLEQLAVGIRAQIIGKILPTAKLATMTNPFALTESAKKKDQARIALIKDLLKHLVKENELTATEFLSGKLPKFFDLNVSLGTACKDPFLDQTADAAARYMLTESNIENNILQNIPSSEKFSADEGLRDVFILNGVLRDTCRMHEIAFDLKESADDWGIEYKKLTKSLNDSTSDTPLENSEALTRRSIALRRQLRSVLQQAASDAGRFKVKSAFWAFTGTLNTSTDKKIRQIPVSLQLIGGEYERRITSAANALLAQMDYADRREVPISTLLADSNPTAFINQILWYDVAGTRLNNDELFSDSYSQDRVRALEAIYTDDTWSRINTVHASGAGDVSMALIKDEIGNWNLKNFDQDTTQLVSTYKGVGLAALRTATTLMSGGATTAASNVSNVQKLVGLANQVALGSGGAGAAAGNAQLEALRSNLIRQLEDLAQEADRDLVKLAVEVAELNSRAEDAVAERDRLRAEAAELRRAVGADLAAGILDTDAAEKEAERQIGRAALRRELGNEKLASDAEAKAKQLTALGQKIKSLNSVTELAEELEARAEKTFRAYANLPARIEGQVRVLLDNYRRMVDALEIGSAGVKTGMNGNGAPEDSSVSGSATGNPTGSASDDDLLNASSSAILQKLMNGELDIESLLRAKYKETREKAQESRKGLSDSFANKFRKELEAGLLDGKGAIASLEESRASAVAKVRAQLSKRRSEALDLANKLELVRSGTDLGFGKANDLLNTLDRKSATFLVELKKRDFTRNLSPNTLNALSELGASGYDFPGSFNFEQLSPEIFGTFTRSLFQR